MQSYLQDYLIMIRVERNLSNKTYEAYQRDLTQYLKYMSDKSFKDVSEMLSVVFCKVAERLTAWNRKWKSNNSLELSNLNHT